MRVSLCVCVCVCYNNNIYLTAIGFSPGGSRF